MILYRGLWRHNNAVRTHWSKSPKVPGSLDLPVYFKKEFDTIDDPRKFVISALQQQTEKIPLDAVLGGNMEFRQIEVLTEDWVMAIYDDGHIQGKSIYEYELQPNGKLKFTEVVSRLPKDR